MSERNNKALMLLLPHGIANYEMGVPGHSRRMFILTVPAAATRADLESPVFWSKHATEFRRNDIVYAVASDNSWEAELRCESVDGHVDMSVVREIPRKGKAAVHLSPTDTLENLGGNLGWCVLRAPRAAGEEPTRIVEKAQNEFAARAEWEANWAKRQPKAA